MITVLAHEWCHGSRVVLFSHCGSFARSMDRVVVVELVLAGLAFATKGSLVDVWRRSFGERFIIARVPGRVVAEVLFSVHSFEESTSSVKSMDV